MTPLTWFSVSEIRSSLQFWIFNLFLILFNKAIYYLSFKNGKLYRVYRIRQILRLRVLGKLNSPNGHSIYIHNNWKHYQLSNFEHFFFLECFISLVYQRPKFYQMLWKNSASVDSMLLLVAFYSTRDLLHHQQFQKGHTLELAELIQTSRN